MRAPAASDERSSLLLPTLGWLAGAMFFFYAWILRVAPSVMVEELMRDFSVGAAVLGHLSAAYFYGYAGMQIPIGILLDRFGPRRLMTVAAFICAAGCVLFATGETLTAATAGRILIGASAAFSLVGAMAIAGQWFAPARFALLSGLAMAAGMAGGVFGQAPLRLAVEATDWHTTMMMLAAAGAALGVFIWATVRDKWRGKGGIGNGLSGLGLVLRHRQTWLTAVTGLATSAPLLGFAGLWGVPFLEAAYGLPRTSAATLTSTLIAGWGIGAPTFGWLSDRIGRRKAPLVIGLTLQSAAFAALVYIPGLPIAAVATLCFLVGLLGASQILCFALVKENHPATLSGTAIGFLNGMVTGTGALFQPLIGLVLDMAWKGQTSHGARIYDAGDYRVALASLLRPDHNVGRRVQSALAGALGHVKCHQRGAEAPSTKQQGIQAMSWMPSSDPTLGDPQSCDALDLVIVPRARDLGGFEVRRALPHGKRQMVGPFIFFDQMGPVQFIAGQGMDVRPHPHIGLATVTYLFDGRIMHRDSEGNALEITPGAMNLMTAGRGITHSERTPTTVRSSGGGMYGIQSWIALPEAHEETDPSFQHFDAADLPVIEDKGVWARVIAGSAFGKASPVGMYSPWLYVEVVLAAGASAPLDADQEERAIYVVDGEVEIAGQKFEGPRLLIFCPGDRITAKAIRPARMLFLGGAAMEGPRYIWWNFVSSSKERIEQAKEEWRSGKFKPVPGETEFIPLPQS